MGQGKYDQAESLNTRVVETARHALGEGDPHTLMMTKSLGDVYLERGKLEQAEAVYAKLLEIRRRVMRPQHPETLGLLSSIGAVRIQQQRFADAEPLLREALTGYEKVLPETWKRYNSQSLLGASMAGQRKYAEAEPLLLSGYQGMRQRETTIPAPDRIELERAGRCIVQLYEGWGKPEQASEWRLRLRIAGRSVR
jgi:tetratricopeptide (TPR) repeat protein